MYSHVCAVPASAGWSIQQLLRDTQPLPTHACIPPQILSRVWGLTLTFYMARSPMGYSQKRKARVWGLDPTRTLTCLPACVHSGWMQAPGPEWPALQPQPAHAARAPPPPWASSAGQFMQQVSSGALRHAVGRRLLHSPACPSLSTRVVLMSQGWQHECMLLGVSAHQAALLPGNPSVEVTARAM